MHSRSAAAISHCPNGTWEQMLDFADDLHIFDCFDRNGSGGRVYVIHLVLTTTIF
jgi:hypothetical protein